MAMLLVNSNYLLFSVIQYLIFCFQAYAAVHYDSSFTLECLEEPPSALYDGGIAVNPELNGGTEGWASFGDAKIEHRVSKRGNNKYIVALERKPPYNGVGQTLYLKAAHIYTVSAWLQVSYGKADLAVSIETDTSYKIVGWVEARMGCWTMLKSGFSVRTSGTAKLYFETNNTQPDVFVDSFSVQPFSPKQWTTQQQRNIQKFRKSRVKIQAVDKRGWPVANATVSLKQRRAQFPFGCAINGNILQNSGYRKWFLKRFKNRFTVFENELKWYYTERSQGIEDYSTADKMVRFAKSNGIAMRGHNVFWDDKRYQPQWVYGLSSAGMTAAANQRIKSVMGKYKGNFIHWDVMNENMHFDFFEDTLGNAAASSYFYDMAHRIDRNTTPFLNEYNIIEDSRDPDSTPEKYMQRIERLRKQGYRGPLGVGVEGHFPYKRPNLGYIKSSLDKFSCTNHKVWITELDVAPGPHQKSYLGHILKELHSHPAVEGIMLWSAWNPGDKCYQMCLTDDNFKNKDTGTVVDKFLYRLSHAKPRRSSASLTDSNGFYESTLNHGDYKVNIINANGQHISESQYVSVVPDQEGTTTTRKTQIHRFTIKVQN